MVVILIRARLYYVASSWSEFEGNVSRIFNIRYGGLAFYGGVLAGVIAAFVVAKWKKIRVHRFFDYLVVYIPLGQAIGRWGKFFNQEAFGRNTLLPWGMISNGTADYLLRTGTGIPSLPVHPTFLYESLANIVIFLVLLKVRRRCRKAYVPTLTYFALYGLVRFFVEGLRTDLSL